MQNTSDHTESKKNKILIVCKGHNNIAGAQLYLKQISVLFPSSDFELHFALNINDGIRVFEDIAQQNKIVLWQYDWRHLSFNDSFIQAYCLLKKISPCIVLFNGTEDKIIAPIWASFFRRIPRRVMVVHWSQTSRDLPVLSRKYYFPVPSKSSLVVRCKRGSTYNLLNKLIFVNNITREAYVYLYKIPSSRCRTIYNGIDIKRFSGNHNQRQNSRRELGIGTDEYMIFAAGNLTEVKGYQYLIPAVHELYSNGVNVKCYIAGQGALERYLQDQIRSIDADGYIKLMGYRDDIPYLLSAADVLCMPSLNEALGYSILEAMASGIPVVASAVGGIPEVITDYHEGILTTPGNSEELSKALTVLYEDEDLRKQMGLLGALKVQKVFSLDKMLSQTKEILLSDM